ncbi:Quino protein alcohol dehydrogenase-like protein [Thozetella sp. PMI_491]|nr:Quino protein alcohol dehydrogenase-like protein [Thozetella sp. PMI_491]
MRLVLAALAARACFASLEPEVQRPIVGFGVSKGREDQEAINTSSFLDNFGTAQIPASQPPPSRDGKWLGFGADVYNNRWASSDGLVDASNVHNLTRACTQHYDPGTSAAPLIEGGIAYYPTWNGLLVALDYQRCETVWRVNISKVILNFRAVTPEQKLLPVPLVARATPVLDGDTLFLGTLAHALLLAFDKRTGSMIDTIQISTHPFAFLTQSPTVYDGRILVGVSSAEEAAVLSVPNYRAVFHGSLNAVTMQHGRFRLLWTTPMIASESPLTGASVWGGQPSIDPIRNQVFIATGNAYSLPAEFEACQKANAHLAAVVDGHVEDPCLPRDAALETVLALDIETGRVNWARRLGPLDAWNAACYYQGPGGPACDFTPGQDSDFGMAPTFVLGSEYTPDGLDIVVIGQKNSNLYALSAQGGMVLWTTSTGPTGVEGGLIWGLAVDDQRAYYTVVNSFRTEYVLPASNGKAKISNSAFGAASLKDGHIVWQTAAPRNTSSIVVPAVVNDLVLTGVSGNYSEGAVAGAGPGSFVAINKYTGKIVREIHLDAFFHGLVATVHDYVMFGTGYGGLEPGQSGTFQVWKLA